MLKFSNQEKTAANFNGRGITLTATEDWDSIGDAPTREAVLRWIAEGNPPEPADEPSPPVINVSPWAIREALNQAGLRDDVEAAVLAADRRTQDAWNHAQDFIRTDPLVVNLGLALGKSEEELDALFALAKSLRAI